MSKELIKQLLTSSNYWTLNKTSVKIFGIETAFLLTNLAEAETLMSDDDGWFYQTSDTLEEITGLTRYKQDKCIEQLENAGVLHKDIRGIPAKRYFKLDYEVLENKFVNNSQTRMRKTGKQELKKLTTNKELNIKNIDKEHINKDIVEQSSQSDKSDDASDDNKEVNSKEIEERFEVIWKNYPRKRGKAGALKQYKKHIKNGDFTDEIITQKIDDYTKEIEYKKTEEQFIKHGSTFFKDGWEDDFEYKEPTKHPFVSDDFDDLPF